MGHFIKVFLTFCHKKFLVNKNNKTYNKIGKYKIVQKGIFMRKIDLHVHSSFSDGTFSPTELVHLAIKNNLAAFALTDHDTVDGIKEAKTATKKLTEASENHLEFITGIEISAGYKNKDIHLLGLFIDETNEKLLTSLQAAKENRTNRNKKMVHNLRKEGIDISMETLVKDNPNAILTRAHFAKHMLNYGYVKSIKQAFDQYLSDSKPYYVPREYISPEKAIAHIREANGIPILAHPLLYHLSEKELKALIGILKEMGLMGLEAIYSSNINNEESYVRGLASSYGLLISGGSDFHGSVKPHISLGTGRGNLNVPISVLEKLKSGKNFF